MKTQLPKEEGMLESHLYVPDLSIAAAPSSSHVLVARTLVSCLVVVERRRLRARCDGRRGGGVGDGGAGGGAGGAGAAARAFRVCVVVRSLWPSNI